MDLMEKLEYLDKQISNSKWFLPKIKAWWRYYQHRNYVVYEASAWELKNRKE